MKKIILSSLFSLSLMPGFAQANDFFGHLTLLFINTGIDTSVELAEKFLHSGAGTTVLEAFRAQQIAHLTKKEIQEIRTVLETGSLGGDGEENLLSSFSKSQLTKLKDIIYFVQSKLRKDLDWQRRDLVDDLANCGINLINAEQIEREFGKDPSTKDTIFGIVLSKKMFQYVKMRSMLKICKWRLALSS